MQSCGGRRKREFLYAAERTAVVHGLVDSSEVDGGWIDRCALLKMNAGKEGSMTYELQACWLL